MGLSFNNKTKAAALSILAHGSQRPPPAPTSDQAHTAARFRTDDVFVAEPTLVVQIKIPITIDQPQQPLRITVAGRLAQLLDRIAARKSLQHLITAALLTNQHGKRLTAAVLRNHFDAARKKAAAANPAIANAILQFHFYDLRAKAADDTSDERGEQAASDLLGHDSVRTTQRHYLRRGKIVGPTK